MSIRGWGISNVGWSYPVALRSASDLPITLSCWMRVSSGSTSTQFCALATAGTATSGTIVLDWNSGSLRIYDADDANSVQHGTVYTWSADGVWHHFAGRLTSMAAAGAALFLDGISRKTSDFGTTLGTTTWNQLNIGYIEPSLSVSAPTTGTSIAEVSLWKGFVSDSEIKSLASGENPLNLGGQARLVAYFPLRGSFDAGHQGRRQGLKQFGAPGAPVWLDHPSVEPWDRSKRSWFLKHISPDVWDASATIGGNGNLSVLPTVTLPNPFSADFSTDFGGDYPSDTLPGTIVELAARATIPGSGNISVLPTVTLPNPFSADFSSDFRGWEFPSDSASGLSLRLAAQAGIAGAGNVNASLVATIRGTATIAGVGNVLIDVFKIPATATISGQGSLTAQARVNQAARATISGSGNVTARLTLYALIRTQIGGVGSVRADAGTTQYYVPAGTISRVGILLEFPAEDPLVMAAESSVLSLVLDDNTILPIPVEGSNVILVFETHILTLSAVDQASAMAIIHPVSVDPAEQIYLLIDAKPLLQTRTEQITSIVLTPSSQAVLDGQTLVDSFYDATNYMVAMKPTGGIAGNQYAWTLVMNTVDVNTKTWKRKRTILVNVASK